MEGKSIDVSEIEERLSDIETKSIISLKILGKQYADKMEAYAKMYRPWTDRTHRARLSLRGFLREHKAEKQLDICIAHGVEYGTSLEFEHEKKYAILFPTLNKFKNEILQVFAFLMEK